MFCYFSLATPVSVTASEGEPLDTTYGNGNPSIHLLFSFDRSVSGTHSFGHYSLLVPSAQKSPDCIHLLEHVPWHFLLLLKSFVISINMIRYASG